VSALFEARATKERVLHLRECASKLVQYILKRTLCVICRIACVNRLAFVHAIPKVSIELIAIQIGEMAFYKPGFIITKSNYFQNAHKAFAPVRERRFRALVLQKGLQPQNEFKK
jgi:hypothetical protein